MAVDSTLVASLIGNQTDTDQATKGLRDALRADPTAAAALKRALESEFISASVLTGSLDAPLRATGCERMAAIRHLSKLWFGELPKQEKSYA